MRSIWSMLLGLAVVFTLALAVQAADEKKADAPKEVTLTGSITCAKCELKESEKCATVIKVKEKDGDKEKDVVYYLDAKSGKDNHAAICKAGKGGKVTGTVSEKDGKKIITATKVEFDEGK